MFYSIGEAAEKLNLPKSTIRYYDKEGLLPFIERRESGIRIFAESDISMLQVIECLKNTGMSIKNIKKFSEWCLKGDLTLKERYELFLEREQSVKEQIAELQKSMNLIEHKCWYYKTALEAGTESIHKNTTDNDNNSN
jgi:DNA-binding transcriptional MerR regulator